MWWIEVASVSVGYISETKVVLEPLHSSQEVEALLIPENGLQSIH